jgi:hypothetical protein
MGQPLTKENLEAEVDAALEATRESPEGSYIIEASYHPEPGLEFLKLRLSDGRRLLIPREELGELKNATPDQAREVTIIFDGAALYWPQLDDGLQLADFLEYRWRKEPRRVAA